MKCSSCNTENPEEAQFCSSCGEYLDWTATSTNLPVGTAPWDLPPPAQPPAATPRHPDSPTAPATEVLPVTPPRTRTQRPATPWKAPAPGRPAASQKPENPQAAQKSPVQPAPRAQPPPANAAAGSRAADASGIRCPSCRRVATAGARFCRCGTALPAAPTVASRPAAPPRRPGPRLPQVAAAVGIGIFVLALVWAVFTLGAGRGADRPAQANASTPADPTTTSAGYPPVRVTAEGRECAREGTGPFAAVGTENTITSCALAINARRAYLESGGKGETITIDAYSPKSDRNYELTCKGAQPTRCTGGKGVRVIIYGGKLVIG